MKTHDPITTYSITYAYASSMLAEALGFSRQGCYVVDFGRSQIGHSDYAAALQAAHSSGLAPDRWSIDHPLNAAYLSPHLRAQMGPACHAQSEAQLQSYQALARYDPHLKVADVYDQDASFCDAICRLITDFEYPDHSHKTIAQVLADFRARARPEVAP